MIRYHFDIFESLFKVFKALLLLNFLQKCQTLFLQCKFAFIRRSVKYAFYLHNKTIIPMSQQQLFRMTQTYQHPRSRINSTAHIRPIITLLTPLSEVVLHV